MKILPIPANSDNYQYLLIDENTRNSVIVDPVDVNSIKAVVSDQRVNLSAALVTHHHSDHYNDAICRTFHGLKVYGGDPDRINSINVVLNDKQEFCIGKLHVKALSTPCHTTTHICYFVEDFEKDERAVFTGDTLFIGGCGRFFEGTPEMMNIALNHKLGNLPEDTKVYCGHEYTVANLKFAKTIEPENTAIFEKLAWAEAERASGRYTIPSSIADEKLINPFMRVSNKNLQSTLGTPDSISTMKKLREMKNNFKTS